MKLNYLTVSISVILSVTFSLLTVNTAQKFGATTVLSTATTDTLETLRTNVNTSLANLSAYAVSTTTAQSWTATQSFSAVGISSTTPLGNIGIGTGTATSSVSGGKFCGVLKDPAGRLMYITLATSGSSVFASSTTSCL